MAEPSPSRTCCDAHAAPIAGARTTRLRACAPFAAVLAVAALAHLPSLLNGFAWDDQTFVIGNPVLRDARNALTLFAKPETWGTGYVNPYYRPLTMLSFLADTLLWGPRAAGYHATSLLLHLGVCGLLLAVLRRLLSPGAALGAALLFAAHPAGAEPVAYVSARADLLCALFLLAAFLAWMRHGESGGRGALAFSALAYTAALFAKAAAGLFPAVFALHGLLFFQRRPRVRDLWPFAAGALLFLTVRGVVLETLAWPAEPVVTRIATAGPLLVRYAVMTISPWQLKVFHDLPPHTAFDATAAAAWLTIAAVTAVAAAHARKAPRSVLALAWFLAGVVPVAGLVVTLSPARAADRYLYVPLLGAALAAGVGLQRLTAGPLTARRRRLAAVAGVLVLAALAGLTMVRGRLWRDSVTLWERAALDAPGNPYVLTGLGWAYNLADRGDEARRALLRSLALEETNAQTHVNLASVALSLRDLPAAERHTLRTLELDPGSATAYRYLSIVMYLKGDAAAARQAAWTACSINPYDASARELLERFSRPEPGTATVVN